MTTRSTPRGAGTYFPSCYKMQPGNRAGSSYQAQFTNKRHHHHPGCICITMENAFPQGRITGPVILPDFQAAFVAQWKMYSHKNHVCCGFETAGLIGSAWTSHWLYHTHMVNFARASEARATRARAREPERSPQA